MLKYILFKLIHRLVLVLPRRWAYWLGCRVADLDFLLRREIRQAVKRNVSHILLTKHNAPPSKALVTVYTKAIFRNFAKYLVDFFSFARFNAENIHELIDIQGLENLQQAFAADKGVVGVTAHLGNWELSAIAVALLGFPINAVALSHENTKINRLFVHQRATKGVGVIPVGASTREYLNVLKEKQLIALAGDRLTSGGGIKVDFMNRPTTVPRGPALLSLRTGAPILPAFMIRTAEDKFKLIFEAPIYSNGLKKNLAEAEHLLTQKVIAIIESYVKKYPEQWFIFYNVWAN